MNSQFFNGFLVLISPDFIFKQTIKEESALKPLLSLLLAAVFFAALGIYTVKNFTHLNVDVLFTQVLLLILSLFFTFIIATAAASGFLNWICSMMIKIKHKKLDTDFLSSFCCHAYLVPLWIFLLFLHIVLSEVQNNIIFIALSIVFIMRFLDIEARLIKVLYKLRLIQGYMLVFMQLILVSIGIAIGFLIRHWTVLIK